ncbi:MAG: tRNA (guanosine(46)-N7)-methyltransferase TrmB, partial [Duncaniella sp.]|nr:tRNA (guanosine(46)-N7)-methyltransferase TrmB [Duncaniella sp.]
HNGLPLLAATDDLYRSPLSAEVPPITTYYEQQWLSRGIPSKYIAWQIPEDAVLSEPDVDIEPDTYRSFGRGTLQGF